MTRLNFADEFPLSEQQVGNARVRVHGEPDKDKIHNALEKFIKKVEQTKGGKKDAR